MGFALYFIVLAVFLALIIRFRRSSSIFALAIAGWIGALFWNNWILSTCSGDCNIRVDLVLIAPLVLLATGFALAEALRRGKQ
jgi:hypothetical protein